MSNVNLSIGGRSFAVACAKGEEDHVTDLGRMIDQKLSTMGEASMQSESRMLLFAALLLADELHETQAQPSAPPAPALPDGAAERLDSLATRLENLAISLEGGPASA